MPDALITQRFSTPALSQKVLEMAAIGVYRESIFEALQPLATKKQIREAITHAKRFGLYSVASLRDPELGTYYQLDQATYEALQSELHSPLHLGKEAELVQRLTIAHQAVDRMIQIARGFTVLLLILSVTCWGLGWNASGFGLLSAGVAAAILWQIQRQLRDIQGK
ncbi:MAG: hypothetical protein MUF72_17720 [Elainella sp. Prado103]|jgi:hypothetical protein|nr:hypothetical protein [Elainella sp. Prado103]